MATKTEPTALIKNIKVGNRDDNNLLITDVLARGNEYAIYEIDIDDINKKLKVAIDGIDDEREANLAKAFVQVKEKYITAKGLLYRSSNFGLMKNRVAHTLATALSGQPDDANTHFDKLIADINKEYTDSFTRRIFYIAPGYFLLTLFTIVLAINALNCISINAEIFQWLLVAFAAIIGGVFSLTLNLPKIRFESELGKLIFLSFGIERISISILAGVICTIGIKSKFIMANLFESSINIWALLFIVILSAFSEKMVPNIIMNVADANGPHKKVKPSQVA
jgi:hypothetical protein